MYGLSREYDGYTAEYFQECVGTRENIRDTVYTEYEWYNPFIPCTVPNRA